MITGTARRTGLLASLLLACVLALGAMPTPAFAVRTLGVSNPKFDFSVGPGGTGKGEVYVINEGDETFNVMVYTASQVPDGKGGIVYKVPKGTEDFLTNPASWIRIQVPQGTKAIGNVPYLVLKPGARELVKFDFTVPPTAPPGDQQVLVFFEMFTFPEAQQGSAATIQGRLGSRIHMRIQGNLNQKFEVRPFEVRQLVIGDQMPYSFALRNDGNIDTDAQSVLTVLDSNENERIRSQAVTQTTLYANSMTERSGVLALTDASFGVFTARLTTTYQKEGSTPGQRTATDIVKDRTIYVVPLWLAIALAVVIGLLVLWLGWAAGNRSARHKTARAAVEPVRSRRSARPVADEDDGPDEYEDVETD